MKRNYCISCGNTIEKPRSATRTSAEPAKQTMASTSDAINGLTTSNGLHSRIDGPPVRKDRRALILFLNLNKARNILQSMFVPPRAYPAHCPSCKNYIVGVTRTFCGHCLESVDDVHDRWFSTEAWTGLDNDHNFTH